MPHERHRIRAQEVWSADMVKLLDPSRLPAVLTRAEVKAVLSHLKDTEWLMASLLYGAGLRLMECLRLRVKDIDFSYHQLVVRDGKGQKDRVTILLRLTSTPRQRSSHQDDR